MVFQYCCQVVVNGKQLSVQTPVMLFNILTAGKGVTVNPHDIDKEYSP